MAAINGTANNDTLNGTFVSDSLSGKGGDDTLYSHQGNDILYGGTGENHLDGGIGADFVDYRWVDDTLSVFVNLATGQSSYHASGGSVQTADTLVDIEAVVTGPGDDTLVGDAGYNTLNGGDGGDSISGGGQSDVLVAGDGRDTLDGGSGSDTVSCILHIGKMVVDLVQGLARFPGTQLPADQLISIERVYTGKGNDTIKGGSEDNIFEGGPDNDKLIGRGGGLDEFTFKRGYDRDTIKDLSPRQGDTVVLKGLGVKNIKQLKDLAEKAGKDVVIDFGRGDELTLEDFSKSDLSQVFFI